MRLVLAQIGWRTDPDGHQFILLQVFAKLNGAATCFKGAARL